MILFALIALQSGPAGLSGVAPHDERLRFVFVRPGSDFVSKDTNTSPRVIGQSSLPTKWSPPAFVDIVQKCGGKGISGSRKKDDSIVVTVNSSDTNFSIARCVQSNTSVHFAVGIASTGYNSGPLNQDPFKDLWDR